MVKLIKRILLLDAGETTQILCLQSFSFGSTMKLLLLSKENIPLAQAEAETLLGRGRRDENVLLIDTKKTTKRLAFTRFLGEVLFDATKSTIERKIKAFRWNELIKRSFAVTVLEHKTASHSLSRLYGGMIYDCLKNPRVDLENPSARIFIIKTKRKLYVCIPEWENEEDFESRKSHRRPGNKPISMQPRLARACVNLTGSTTAVYDPLCGLGGFLIEAGLIGLKAIGSDVDKHLIQLCAKNLQHYGVTNYLLFQKDVFEIDKKYDFIVTDVPYGKNTKNIPADFYERFIKILKQILKKRAVVVFPHFSSAEKLLKKHPFKIKGKYSAYIHKGLTRNIFVLEK